MQTRFAKQDQIYRIFCSLHGTGFEVPTSCTQNEKKSHCSSAGIIMKCLSK
jgi:hypothetical protein